jgi:hypothetical protein
MGPNDSELVNKLFLKFPWYKMVSNDMKVNTLKGVGIMADPIGLKKMRRNTKDRHPSYVCTNCNCTRYSPCTCRKSMAWTRKQEALTVRALRKP